MAFKDSTDKKFQEQISGDKLSLIQFSASWCGPCQQLKPIIEKISNDKADKIDCYYHDIESQPNEPTKYSVRGVPKNIYSNSNIYGQGLIDLDAATKPIGDTMVATIGSSLSNLHLKEEDSYIGIIGPAYGNAISKRLGELSYVVFDEDGAPFNKSLNKRVLNNTPNINWLTSFQLNPNKRIDQRLVPTEGGGILKLGINENSLYDFKFPSLWANTENKLSYFSFEQKLTHNSKLFFGNGRS